jgi:hypothetical protein
MGPKNDYRSMQIIGYKSLEYRDSVRVNSKLDYHLASNLSLIGCHMLACRPLVG